MPLLNATSPDEPETAFPILTGHGELHIYVGPDLSTIQYDSNLTLSLRKPYLIESLLDFELWGIDNGLSYLLDLKSLGFNIPWHCQMLPLYSGPISQCSRPVTSST